MDEYYSDKKIEAINQHRLVCSYIYHVIMHETDDEYCNFCHKNYRYLGYMADTKHMLNAIKKDFDSLRRKIKKINKEIRRQHKRCDYCEGKELLALRITINGE